MKRILILGLTLFLSIPESAGQFKMLTAAEKNGFKSTSDYDDVISFIEKLKESSEYIRVENIATSAEDRNVPLLIIGNPLPESQEDISGDSRIVVYIQANIHAGEVEGKEATLMFARDLLSEKNPEFLDNIIILICPNLNPDGNEKITPRNRTYQNGPENGVGVRHNGLYLDLNRDAMKAESPEVRGVITKVFNTWDPAVFMDCHTTNGSYHVEPVTFTWMVNPNGDNTLINYMRTRMMPEMSAALFNEYKVENCYYGEFNDMMKPENGWFYDAAEPRYIINYFGLRNRLAILNENYVYADFKTRVWGCYYLIRSLMDYVSLHKDEIKSMLKEADAKTLQRGSDPSVTDSFAIEYKVRPVPENVTIKTFEAEPVTESDAWPSYRKTDRQKTVSVPYFIDYFPVKSIKFPYAYLITVYDPEIINLLKIHGIRIEKLKSTLQTEVERFEITELKGAPRLYQGHYTNSVKGRYISETAEFPSGTIVVRCAQPLANLAAYLLEPQSNDGLMTWNYFDRYLIPQWGSGFYPYPVYRVVNKKELKTNPFAN